MIPPLAATLPRLPAFVVERIQLNREPFFVSVEFPAIDLAVMDRILEAPLKKIELDLYPFSELQRSRNAKSPEPELKRHRGLFDADCKEGPYIGKRRLPDSLPWCGALCYQNVSFLIARTTAQERHFRRRGDGSTPAK